MALISRLVVPQVRLYGSAFMGMMKAEQAGQDLAGVLEAGLEMIKKRGHAEAGEKTMVDVWHPVVEAVKQGQLTIDVIDQAVLSTKELRLQRGVPLMSVSVQLVTLTQVPIRLAYSSRPC